MENWRNAFSAGEMERANEILRLFGLNHIYDSATLPLIKGFEVLAPAKG
jgi:hypothetical protein